MWALKNLNFNWGAISSKKINDMNKVDEFYLKSYQSSILYNEKTNTYHDQNIEKHDFFVGD